MKSIEDLIKDQDSPEPQQGAISDAQMTEETTEAENPSIYSSYQVIDLLKKSLNIHWQQTTSLTAQSEHLERWGYKKLAEILKEDAIEEQVHASINVKRLEFFDVDYQPIIVSPPTWKRHDMVSMIQYNLASVREAASTERDTIVAARAVGDEITANMMIPLLQGSENGIELYESFLKLIEQMGIEDFLSLQV